MKHAKKTLTLLTLAALLLASVSIPVLAEDGTDALPEIYLDDVEETGAADSYVRYPVLITPDDVPLDRLTNPKALNTMMLGALASHLSIDRDRWIEELKAFLPEKLHALNIEMFDLGFQYRKH